MRYMYKAIKYSMVLIMSRLYTINFKLYLVLNGVVYGKGIRCYNSTPQLQINRKGYLYLGSGATFNSYTETFME